jgi:acetoin utilization protein AcuB
MDDSLDLIRRIFDETGFHHLVVREDRKPVGVISDRDLLRHLSPFIGNDLMERPQDVRTLRKRAHQIMHRDLVTIDEHDSLQSASHLLLKHRVGCLPVVDGQGNLKGIVTWRDLLPHCRWDEEASPARAA